jgi:hypothetical protein
MRKCCSTFIKKTFTHDDSSIVDVNESIGEL